MSLANQPEISVGIHPGGDGHLNFCLLRQEARASTRTAGIRSAAITTTADLLYLEETLPSHPEPTTTAGLTLSTRLLSRAFAFCTRLRNKCKQRKGRREEVGVMSLIVDGLREEGKAEG